MRCPGHALSTRSLKSSETEPQANLHVRRAAPEPSQWTPASFRARDRELSKKFPLLHTAHSLACVGGMGKH